MAASQWSLNRKSLHVQSNSRSLDVSSSMYSLRKIKHLTTPFIFISFFFTIFLLPTLTASRLVINQRIPTQVPIFPHQNISYAKYCNDLVPESPLDPNVSYASPTARSLGFRVGFFTGGEEWQDEEQTATSTPKSTSFFSYYAHKALADATYKIDARLTLLFPRSFSSPGKLGRRRRLLRMRFRGPRVHAIGHGKPSFGFTGFWSESTGKLCMVGSGLVYTNAGKSRSLKAVLKLNYSTNSTIYGTLVKGVLESIDNQGDSNYFQPVSILGVGQNDRSYEFKLAEKGNHDRCLDGGNGLSINDVNGKLCSFRSDTYGLEYGNDCSNISCNPLYGRVAYLPNTIYLQTPDNCVDKLKIPMLLSFSSSSNINNAFPFDPSTALVAEGAWDENKKSFCAVACRILNYSVSLSNAVVGDCSIKLSLRFPASVSIKRMSGIEGELSSDKTENEVGYFRKISFWSLKESFKRFAGIRYEYTEINRVRKYCGDTNITFANRKGKNYPDGNSADMRFHMLMKNSKGKINSGYASPLFLGDQLYQNQLEPIDVSGRPTVAVPLKSKYGELTNISYRFSFSSDFRLGDNFNASKGGLKIFAEGMYDKDSGSVCMIGCLRLEPKTENGKFRSNDSVDCDIVVNIFFSPLNSKTSDRVKGSIESTREKADPLYFGRIDFWSKSMTTKQAKESVWRMDLEIAMVLISNTLACLFVGLQLYHVRKQPDVLPFISIIMLILLTLGHMIPLLLNFEALFVPNRSQQNPFLRDGGWLEVNEILVRIVTMVAFLLEFRLLQLSWTARYSHDNQRDLWVSDKKVLLVSLPLYIIGGLIAWFVNHFKNTHASNSRRMHHKGFIPLRRQQQRSLWVDLKSYGGLIRDGFLLPQIMFNAFLNSTENALAATFYIGSTLVRLLPHAYDLYRGQNSTWYLDWSYIYANHKVDFFSTAWDIIIPCGGLLFAVLVFVQQRFGGRSILPRRFRKSSTYEKVPTVNSEEMQGEVVQKNFYSL